MGLSVLQPQGPQLSQQPEWTWKWIPTQSLQWGMRSCEHLDFIKFPIFLFSSKLPCPAYRQSTSGLPKSKIFPLLLQQEFCDIRIDSNRPHFYPIMFPLHFFSFIFFFFSLLYPLLSYNDSVQFSYSVMSSTLWPHGLQHARLPCPLPTPGACSNSCSSSWWCHPTISSSVILPSIFSSIRIFPKESVLCIIWPKYWSFSFGISPTLMKYLDSSLNQYILYMP